MSIARLADRNRLMQFVATLQPTTKRSDPSPAVVQPWLVYSDGIRVLAILGVVLHHVAFYVRSPVGDSFWWVTAH